MDHQNSNSSSNTTGRFARPFAFESGDNVERPIGNKLGKPLEQFQIARHSNRGWVVIALTQINFNAYY
jgi:uncharacterized protein YfaP (DUF2135 family)